MGPPTLVVTKFHGYPLVPLKVGLGTTIFPWNTLWLHGFRNFPIPKRHLPSNGCATSRGRDLERSQGCQCRGLAGRFVGRFWCGGGFCSQKSIGPAGQPENHPKSPKGKKTDCCWFFSVWRKLGSFFVKRLNGCLSDFTLWEQLT